VVGTSFWHQEGQDTEVCCPRLSQLLYPNGLPQHLSKCQSSYQDCNIQYVYSNAERLGKLCYKSASSSLVLKLCSKWIQSKKPNVKSPVNAPRSRTLHPERIQNHVAIFYFIKLTIMVMRDDHNIYRRQVLDRKWNRYKPETIKLECLDLSQVSEWSRYHYHGSLQHTSRLYNTTQENSTLHKFLENWGPVHGVIPVPTTDINHTDHQPHDHHEVFHSCHCELLLLVYEVSRVRSFTFWDQHKQKGSNGPTTLHTYAPHIHDSIISHRRDMSNTLLLILLWFRGKLRKKRKKIIIAEVLNNLQDIYERWTKAKYFTWISEHINFVKLKQEGGMPYPCCLQIHPWISTPPLSRWNLYLIFHKSNMGWKKTLLGHRDQTCK